MTDNVNLAELLFRKSSPKSSKASMLPKSLPLSVKFVASCFLAGQCVRFDTPSFCRMLPTSRLSPLSSVKARLPHINMPCTGCSSRSQSLLSSLCVFSLLPQLDLLLTHHTSSFLSCQSVNILFQDVSTERSNPTLLRKTARGGGNTSAFIHFPSYSFPYSFIARPSFLDPHDSLIN